jgi:hypothetical protein
MASSQPNPGSDAALAKGCNCPVLDNGHGNPELGRIRGFYITAGCPLHGMPADAPEGWPNNDTRRPEQRTRPDRITR